MKIRIGTRTSLMAMAQAKIVARLLKEHHPGIETEFVGIIPSGDKDKTTPLPQMNTIGIFSKEIDDHLLDGRIDIAVHSLKDLGTQRPAGIARAAILKRDDVHDIVLFHPDIQARLNARQKIVIGTSAPRRGELLPSFLQKALPAPTTPEIELISIRGNANTRIAKLLSPEQNLDGIVLALAGLERLYNDDEAHCEVTKLLAPLKRMIVPVTVCPPAPGQGTVCIEALDSRPDIHELLAPLNDAETQKAIEAEYTILTANGGGCHQRFGVLSFKLPNIQNNILMVRGKNKDGKDISGIQWTPPAYDGEEEIWNGHDFADGIFVNTDIDHQSVTADAVFVAHTRAFPKSLPQDKHIWVSGVKSWFKLAQKGYWVEGCADSFGFEFIKRTLTSPVLQLPPLKSWDILSHEHAEDTWNEGNFIATYSHEGKDLSAKLVNSLQNADIIWWASASQYHALSHLLPTYKQTHACGPGKTAEILLAQGVSPLYVFPNIDTMTRWIDDNRAQQHTAHSQKPAGKN